MIVVVMFEPAAPSENLTLSGQVNQVFGPFETDEEAEAWTARMTNVYGATRQWLIIPVDDPKVVRDLDIGSN